MKKQLAGLFFLSVSLICCKPNPAAMIAKKWQPIEAKGESITPESREILLEPGNGMAFLPDGRFVTYGAGEQNDTGTYSLSNDYKSLKVYSSQKNETIFEVQELKTNRLIIENHGLVLVLKPTD